MSSDVIIAKMRKFFAHPVMEKRSRSLDVAVIMFAYGQSRSGFVTIDPWIISEKVGKVTPEEITESLAALCQAGWLLCLNQGNEFQIL